MLYHIISYHIISYHIISYYIISYISFLFICFCFFLLDAEMRFYNNKSNRSDGDKIVAAVQIVDPATGKVVMIAPDVGLRYVYIASIIIFKLHMILLIKHQTIHICHSSFSYFFFSFFLRLSS